MKALAHGRSSGFTLIELMVVIAVLGVLAALAGPSFSSFISAQRIRNASFDLVSDLLLARSEALTRQTAVVITPSSSSADGWTGGWRLNATSASGALITNRTDLPASIRFVPSATLSSLNFGPDGRTVAGTTFTVRGAEEDAASKSNWSCVRLDATGRAQSSKGACP